jgi:serine protease
MSGTSMAAPFVSGIAGLLLDQESTLTTGEIRQRIVDTAVNNSTLIDYAQSGRIDAYRTLMNVQD